MRPVGRRHLLAEAAWLALSSVLAVLVAAWVLQLWDARLHVPLVYGSDGMLGLQAMKGLIETGWYFKNPSVGAPSGQVAFDFAALDADTLQWLLLWPLSKLTTSAPLVLTTYFVLGFALVAATTYVSLRLLGITRPVACVSGVLLAVIPYHFAHGPPHLFLAAYFAIPAIGFLIIRLVQGEPLIVRWQGVSGRRALLTPITVWSLASIVLAGGSTLYYAVFALVMLSIVALVRAVQESSLRAAGPALTVVAAIGVVLVLNVAPGILYQVANGPNEAVAKRIPLESLMYSTTFAELVLPIPGHRISALAEYTAQFRATGKVPGEGTAALGGLLALSLMGLLVWMVGYLTRGHRPVPPDDDVERESRLLAAASAGGLIATLLGVFGGVSMLIALFVTPQIRAWNRIAPLIAFFALVGFAVAADKVVRRMRARGGVVAFGAMPLLLAVALLAVLDMTPRGGAWRPDYAGVLAQWQNDSRFIAEVERLLPERDASVLQLPFHPFPEEWGQVRMTDYDHFRAYVHSKRTKWSYGAMKGRSGDWTAAATDRSLRSVVPAAVAAGFDGVYVDRWGYEDNGAKVERVLTKLLGPPRVVSNDGRLVFYLARKLETTQRRALSPRERLRLGQGLVDPVSVRFTGAFAPPERDTRGRFRWLAGERGAIELDAPGRSPQRVTVAATVIASPATTLRLRLPGGGTKTVRGAGPTRIRLETVAKPDGSRVDVSASGPDLGPSDPRDLRVRFDRMSIEPVTR